MKMKERDRWWWIHGRKSAFRDKERNADEELE